MPLTGKPGRRGRHGMPLFLGVVLAGAACLAFEWAFWWRRPAGAGPVGISVRRQAFQRPWTTRPVLLVGMGDSVTAGFGAGPGHSYFDRLTASPPDEFPDVNGLTLQAVFPSLRVTNLAISGSSSRHHARQQVARLTVQTPETLGVVVITSGGNDLLHNYGRTPPAEGAMFGATLVQATPWLLAFSNRLGELTAQVTNRFPGGCHIFLGSIYDPTDGLGDIDRAGPLPGWPDGLAVLARANEILRGFAAARPNVHLVDIHGAFLGHGIHCAQFWRSFHDRSDPHYWFNENLEDPNDRGYDALRRLFLNEMARALGPQ